MYRSNNKGESLRYYLNHRYVKSDDCQPEENIRSYRLLASALLVTNLLFFIDEGYYDFRWMLDIGNWLIFIIYTCGLFVLQMLFFEIVLRSYRGPGKLLFSIIGGLLVAIILIAWLVWPDIAAIVN